MDIIQELNSYNLLKKKEETTTSAMVGADQAKVDVDHEVLRRRYESVEKMKKAFEMFSEAYGEFMEREMNELYCPHCKPYDWSSRRDDREQFGQRLNKGI